ncbi:sporulation membrane protein YtaF [Anaerosinus sp.]|uniref:sporulation membrane protein YtaF n=1 Tax=Selenobaculum sp. TaxID=3074374 RepID=UPI003AB1EDF6
MKWLIILGFAVSSSIDNLGVGLSYGIRNIRINWLSNLIIAAICFIFSYFGILFGLWIADILPGSLPDIVAAFLLFVIGIRIILMTTPRKKKKQNLQIEEKQDDKSYFEQILSKPEIADLDRSNEIGILESIILGSALSANALTNGLSAGLIGLSPFAISLTAAVGSLLTISLGTNLGKRMSDVHIGRFSLGEFGTLISALIIILIALETVFH